MIVPVLLGTAGLVVMVFGGKICEIYLAALESLGVPAQTLEFFGKVFPALRWVFAPVAVVLAVTTFFVR